MRAPPREKVLQKLASLMGPYLPQAPSVLADHQITLDGKFPSDVAETQLRNSEAMPFLRSLGSAGWTADP